MGERVKNQVRPKLNFFVMKINTFRLSHLRNHEHFQFHTEIVELINEANPETLRIKPQYEAYRLLYEHEDEAVVKIMGQATSTLSKIRNDSPSAK